MPRQQSGRSAQRKGAEPSALDRPHRLIPVSLLLILLATCAMYFPAIAWELGEAGRHQEAIDHYHSAIALRPNYAEAHNNLARVLINADQLPEAINELQTAIKLKPDNYQALNNLGVALDHQGRFPEAIESLEHSIRIQPNFADAYQNLGNTLKRMGACPRRLKTSSTRFD